MGIWRVKRARHREMGWVCMGSSTALFPWRGMGTGVVLAEPVLAEWDHTPGRAAARLFIPRVINGGAVSSWQRASKGWLCPPYMLRCNLKYQKDISSLLPSGCVCPPMDSHVLSVPGGPLLHCVVCPVPALHGCDCRTAKDTHNNGTELDDHCCASTYFWGKLSTAELLRPWRPPFSMIAPCVTEGNPLSLEITSQLHAQREWQ